MSPYDVGQPFKTLVRQQFLSQALVETDATRRFEYAILSPRHLSFVWRW